MSNLFLYRRAFDSEVWHFMKGCSLWPTDHFDQRSEEPVFGVLCTVCATLAGRLGTGQQQTPPNPE